MKRQRASAFERAGRALAERLPETPAFAAAGRVVLYAALPDEVPTRYAFAAALPRKRSLWFPRTVATGLEFAPVERWEALRPGAHGVLEPEPSAPAEPLAATDLVLVPGLAFDRRGRRLGRGGGHYDRAFPPDRPHPLLYGVAFAWQVLDALPSQPHDLRVDALLTEEDLRPIDRRVEC